MGFRGQVQNSVGLFFGEQRLYRRAIANIGLHETVARIALDCR